MIEQAGEEGAVHSPYGSPKILQTHLLNVQQVRWSYSPLFSVRLTRFNQRTYNLTETCEAAVS